MENKKTLNNIPEWKPDVLGEDFLMRHVSQGCDYAGDVRCTIVRKLADNGCSRGILYIHGFCDYFFQKEMANRFVKEGYNFYAVDLRKYGRSYMDGQKMFQVRDLTEYFPDIQAGIEAMKEDGNNEIILMGHSTGGLTTSLYMQCCADPCIKALILNSPFFAWNLSKVMIRLGIPILKTLAVLIPGIRVKGDGTNN